MQRRAGATASCRRAGRHREPCYRSPCCRRTGRRHACAGRDRAGDGPGQGAAQGRSAVRDAAERPSQRHRQRGKRLLPLGGRELVWRALHLGRRLRRPARPHARQRQQERRGVRRARANSQLTVETGARAAGGGRAQPHSCALRSWPRIHMGSEHARPAGPPTRRRRDATRRGARARAAPPAFARRARPSRRGFVRRVQHRCAHTAGRGAYLGAHRQRAQRHGPPRNRAD